MLKFIAWRIAQLPLILAVIYLITFLLVWVAPGSPFGNPERKLDPAAEKRLREQFHADSIPQFLAYYPKQIIEHGDLGPSMNYHGWSVNDVLRYSLPVSLALGLLAMFIATIGGCMLGVMAALRKGGLVDYLSVALALVGISVPSFVVAALLLLIFADVL